MISVTTHNIFYYQDLMKEIREAIEEKKFGEFAQKFPQNETLA
jgi:queuine tRNA-ribosyltransferase